MGLARLYPEASTLPAEAAEKFASRAGELTQSAPLQFIVESCGFRVGDTEIAAGNSQVASLAESLHAMQVGQLVIAPGLTSPEVQVFVKIATAEPSAVRTAGGVRTLLVNGGVRNLAVIEVSLRSSDDDDLAGIDLSSAPVDEIADAVAAAVRRRAQAASKGAAPDEVADALGRVEDATRGIAMERVAAAMLRLDENTRMAVLAMALMPDKAGKRMDGMLAVVARMKPASLARLLTLVAKQVGTEPRRVAAALTLPPETAKMLALILSPAPSVEPDLGMSPQQQAVAMAEQMAVVEDTSDTDRQIAVASPALSSGRALATATAVSHSHLDVETVRAMGEVLPSAAADGSFTTVREALRRLDELSTRPQYADAVQMARASLAEPAVLAEVCRAPETDADAAIAGEILQAAGPAGAEALLDAYVRSGEPRRSLMRPVMRGMSEAILGVARQRLRGAEPGLAIAIIRALPALGDRRAAQVVAEQVNHLDESVRFAAISTLAAMPSPESTAALVKALNHREPETQRHVVREIGNARIAGAVGPLTRALEDVNVFGRTYETRKEIIRALEQIGTPEAERSLRMYQQRTLGLGRKVRELRKLATTAADNLARNRGVDQP